MEFTPCDCPHPQCTPYGRRGGAPLVRRGADCGIPRLLCTQCKGTFSARQGTAYFGGHAEVSNDTIAMRALAEGRKVKISIRPRKRRSSAVSRVVSDGKTRATYSNRSIYRHL